MLQIKLIRARDAETAEEKANTWLSSREVQKFEILGLSTSLAGAGTSYYGNNVVFETLVTITYDDDPKTQADVLKEVASHLPPRPKPNPTPIR